MSAAPRRARGFVAPYAIWPTADLDALRELAPAVVRRAGAGARVPAARRRG